MKAAMIKYMRESNYMNFRKAVQEGMTVDDYKGVYGEELLPITLSHVVGLHKYILTKDVEWVKLLPIRVIIKYLITQPYNKELDEYFINTPDFKLLQDGAMSIYYQFNLATLRGMSIFVSNLREFDTVGNYHNLIQYKFIPYHMGNLMVEALTGASTLEYVRNMVYKYIYKNRKDGEYEDANNYFLSQVERVDGLINNIKGAVLAWDVNKERIEDAKVNCDYCAFHNHSVITKTEGGLTYQYERVTQNSQDVIQTKIITSVGTEVVLHSEFCSHCGRHISDNRWVYLSRGGG